MYQPLDRSLPTSASTLAESTAEEGRLFLNEYSTKPAREQAQPTRQHGCTRLLAISLLGIMIAGLLVMYAVFPIAFYNSSWLRRTLLFEAYQSREDLSNPADYGLNCSRNFYIHSEPAIRIGAWYVASGGVPCNSTAPMFSGNGQVLLLMHGIKANRGENHRVRLAQRLAQEANVDVVAIDYRGFGDSTYETPSLPGETTDALALYKVIRVTVPAERIILWGHSMGTAVAMRMAAELHQQNDSPSAIVLEGTFDNVGRLTRHSPLSRLWRWMPWFDIIFSRTLMHDPDTAADNALQAYLINPSLPVLMLQAEDDQKTPLDTADSLRKHIIHSRRDSGSAGPVKSVLFSKKHKLGHNWLAKYPNITRVVRQFFDNNTVGDGVIDQIVL